MQRAKDRVIDGYVEKHHVIPRCMGGDNSKENLVILTAPEHYVAHLLLVKMHPDHRGLLWAASAMTNGTRNQHRSGNKMYEWLRKRLSVMMSDRVVSDETRAKLSASAKGNQRTLGMVHSDETKRRMSVAARRRGFTPEHREKIRQARTGKPGAKKTPECIEKIRQSNIIAWQTRDKSYFQNAEYKRIQSEKMKAIWEQRRLGVSPMPFKQIA